MKKALMMATAVALLLTSCGKKTLSPATADETGKIQTIELNDHARLYVYNSGDAMYDASFIVEGIDSLVLMETPLFKDADAEFEAFVGKIGEPVAAVITDYHEGGQAGVKNILAEGFPAFIEGPVYGGMMAHFQEVWGEQLVTLPNLEGAEEVAWGETKTIDGIPFRFEHGASSDFPAASIIIANKAYLTHWAPVQMHISPLQVSSREAIDAEIEQAEAELNSGCDVFVGSHCGVSSKEAVEWKLAYLKTLRDELGKCATADEWMAAVEAAYPGLQGEDNLKALAAIFYATPAQEAAAE